jgi:hypothetical protein
MMSKPLPGIQKKKPQWFLFNVIQWFLSVVYSLKARVSGLTASVRDARKGYACLVQWGKKSGLSCLPGETSLEYARRLGQRFPRIEKEITTIVHAFHLEIYGERPLETQMHKKLTQALKTIHSPSLWPMRIKSFLNRA